MASTDPQPILDDHSRQWRDNLYVYPVVSRRARGMSIGINLNPDASCNYDCVYCQVNRALPPGERMVDMRRLRQELEGTVGLAASGHIWKDPRFADVPLPHRRINDIAFSGNGEPTTFRNFDAAVQLAAEVRASYRLDDVKIVVISNASAFHAEPFQRALPLLQANHGEVWAKLDAGSEAHYRRINRSHVSFQQVLDNIERLARTMPIVIQTLLLRYGGEGPGAAEIDAYIGRLRHIIDTGGQIRLVQVHTVAREPAEPEAEPLAEAELQTIAARIRQALPEAPVEVYPGTRA